LVRFPGGPENTRTHNLVYYNPHPVGDREIFDAFERIRDTAVLMRAALAAGDWDEVGRQIEAEWENRKRLAAGVTTDTVDDLMARARAAGATAAKVCGAGGGGCLFSYGPPAARPAIAEALALGGARVLDFHIEADGLRVDSPAMAGR
jgi:D-glycero-alpha-D-manno-heptose-7-phosphate kinase